MFLQRVKGQGMGACLGSLAAVVTVFGWSFFSFWSAIPAGIALGVSPLVVCLTVTVSYGSGAALVVIVGAPLRERVRRMVSRAGARGGAESVQAVPEPHRMVLLAQRAWTRYGLLGLSILAPMTVGSQVGAVIGLGFGECPWWLVLAMTLGAAMWALLITLAVFTGVMTAAAL